MIKPLNIFLKLKTLFKDFSLLRIKKKKKFKLKKIKMKKIRMMMKIKMKNQVMMKMPLN